MTMCENVHQVVVLEAAHFIAGVVELHVGDAAFGGTVAVDQKLAFHGIDQFGRPVDESLRVVHRVGQPLRFQQDARDRRFGEPRFRLHLGHEIGHGIARFHRLRSQPRLRARHAAGAIGLGPRLEQIAQIFRRRYCPIK